METNNTTNIGRDLLKSLEELKIDERQEEEEKGKVLASRVTPDLDQIKEIDRRTDTTSSDNNEEDIIYDLEDIEPVELWNEDSGYDNDGFTEEELINVLRSFDDENNDEENKEGFQFECPREVLPELEFEVDGVDDEDADALLLAPAEFTASIFDPDVADIEIDDDEEEIDVEREEEEKKVEVEEGNQDNDDFGLAAALQGLNLNWEDEDDVPPFLWCQPVTPVGGTPESTLPPFVENLLPLNRSLAPIKKDSVLIDTTAATEGDLIELDTCTPVPENPTSSSPFSSTLSPFGFPLTSIAEDKEDKVLAAAIGGDLIELDTCTPVRGKSTNSSPFSSTLSPFGFPLASIVEDKEDKVLVDTTAAIGSDLIELDTCTPVGGKSTNSSPFSSTLSPFGFPLTSVAEDSSLLAAIDLSQFDQDRPKLPEQFDSLLQLAQLKLEDGSNLYLSESEMESLFEEGAAVVPPKSNEPSQPSLEQAETQQKEQQNEKQQQENSSDQEMFNVSQRPEALEAAGKLLANFVANRAGLENERSCLGHKETIYGTAFSECGRYLATASSDSTVRIWDVATNSSLTTLTEHSTEYECLRVAWASSHWGVDSLKRGEGSQHALLLATSGADGTVKVWANRDPKQKHSWTCCATIDHCDFDRIPANPDDDTEKPQVYALQWINHWRGLPAANNNNNNNNNNESSARNSFLLTSSDDFIHLWELEPKTHSDDSIDLNFREVMSLHFASFHNYGYGVSICQVTKEGLGVKNSAGQTPNRSLSREDQTPFGGDRNPQNMVFVFDAEYCEANGLLGVALSDGTLRLINGRGICISIMSLPGCQSHLTSFSWDSTGTRLATCVATGHVILWGILVHEGWGSLTTTCAAILEGGHELGRPVFGTQFFSDEENLLLSWGVDGRLCVWDSFSEGNIHAPIATLVSNSEYPIYAVDVQSACIAVGGGGGESGFLGIPVYIYDTQIKKES